MDKKDDLVQALCAYSLATTSGARDVLWQLLQVRSQAMAAAFIQDSEEDEITPDDVMRGLGLYTKTLLDLQALMPHRLPDALLGLKKRPLLDDAGLQQLEDLRLDVYARWCGEDVQFFKPYVRHDDVDAAQLRQLRSQWARRGPPSCWPASSGPWCRRWASPPLSTCARACCSCGFATAAARGWRRPKARRSTRRPCWTG